jgi:hypothetical protein
MKKILFLMLFMSLMFSSCSKCSSEHNALTVEGDSAKAELVVENLISTDKENMYLNYGDNYRWYETCVLMKDFLDGDTNGDIDMVSNIFQSIVPSGTGYDTQVLKYQYFADGTFAKDSVKGFWIEDLPLADSLIKIPYDSAFALIQKVNLPKPHTRNAILRNPIGPKAVNPQWVFGNIKEQLWVDAVSGEIKQSNPAFEGSFGMPLGEWP